MNRRNLLLVAVAGLLAAAAALWWFVLRSDAPPPVSLEDAVETVTDGSDVPATIAREVGALDGTWTLDAAASFAGYRVQEELAGIGTTEAVGRTSSLTGELTIEGSAVRAARVDVDMTSLRSDSGQRDGALRSRGLETNDFPTATFTLTEPVDFFAAVPDPGDTVVANAVGDLTLHGVTRAIEIRLDGRLVDGDSVVVVGSTEVALADYDIEPPTGLSVLSIEDVGTIELQLVFTRQ